MTSRHQLTRSIISCCIAFLALTAANAQKLRPDDIDPRTEDVRCVEKNYHHKTAAELSRMTPERLIDESEKEWNYHVALMDTYGMFTLGTYTSKIGTAIIPVLVKLAGEFESRPFSICQQQRFFTALAIASDVDDQVVRLRTRKDGQAAISASADAIRKMKEAGLANNSTNPYNKYAFGEYMLAKLRWINSHDESMRELLKEEFGVEMSNQEFAGFVSFLTSTYPTYPAWTPRVNESRNLKLNKKKYHDAYLRFKKTVSTSDRAK